MINTFMLARDYDLVSFVGGRRYLQGNVFHDAVYAGRTS
jgi:hypothetical protein